MKSLPITEDLDFEYLLELMPPLHDVPEYCWLPELFSIIGYENLIVLCKYAGGEIIKIPTIEELSDSIRVLQEFYNIYFKKSMTLNDVESSDLELLDKIIEVYTC